MKAGSLDTLISVWQKSTTKDGQYNTDVITWVPLVALPGSPVLPEKWWAEVMDSMPSRSEAIKQGLAMAANQARIRLRYRGDIDSSMRIVVHRDVDVTYQIIGGPAMVGGRKAMLELMCERNSTQGDGP